MPPDPREARRLDVLAATRRSFCVVDDHPRRWTDAEEASGRHRIKLT